VESQSGAKEGPKEAPIARDGSAEETLELEPELELDDDVQLV
jgi:hypothetical protein